MLWDVFCKVIDNDGDIGVCWRLSAQLAARGEQVRLLVDDASALVWMAPNGQPGVAVHAWDAAFAAADAGDGDVVIEAFGCELPPSVVERLARRGAHAPAWINLEYLTAEGFAQRCHGLASPVLAGPGAGLAKRFYYPGFVPATGGLLREADLVDRQRAFDAQAWLAQRGIAAADELRISLFCYEPQALGALLGTLARGTQPVRLLAAAGRASEAVRAVLAKKTEETPGQPDATDVGALSITFLPHLSQTGFDHLLWSCDLNFVRGEDSLVRALWAGKPFVWQIYPQDDGAHLAKLQAFLDWLDAPASLREFHAAWNGNTADLPALDLPGWATCTQAARKRLLAQDDLATQLIRFISPRQ